MKATVRRAIGRSARAVLGPIDAFFLQVTCPVVDAFEPGFPEADCAYNGTCWGDHGELFFALSTHRAEMDARLFRFDPGSGEIAPLPPFSPAVARLAEGGVAHGKVHVPMAYVDGSIYFATHVGFYDTSRGFPSPARREGLAPYRGGLFLEYQTASRSFEILGSAPSGEGIISMATDFERGRLFGLTWPRGLLLQCDLEARRAHVVRPVLGVGETVAPWADGYQPICRCLASNPGDGTVFWTDRQGCVWAFEPDATELARVGECDLAEAVGHRPAGSPEWGYTWRNLTWHGTERAYYGLVGTLPPVLFRFDPVRRRLAALGEVGVTPQGKVLLRHAWTTLALALSEDGTTLHYFGLDRRRAGALRCFPEVARLVSFHIPSATQRIRGPFRLPDGRIVTGSEAITTRAGMIYALAAAASPRSWLPPRGDSHQTPQMCLVRVRADFE